jgi:peptide/nickel transport system permease protein
MIGRLARRLGWTLAVVWLALSLTFVLAHVIPVDPARAAAGLHADAAAVARARARMCLGRSLAAQYACFVGRTLRGELGESFRTRRPVADLVRERAWPTVQLAVAAVFLQLLGGIPLGLGAALRRGGALDRAILAVAAVAQAAPVFFLGPLLVYLVAYRLDLLPVAGYGTSGLDRLRHLILPTTTLAIPGLAALCALVRGELIDALDEPHVRTARAKGLGGAAVVLRHGLRNALAPLVTFVGLELGELLGGALVVEWLFGWPGLGREALLAVAELDLPVLLAVTLCATIAIAGVNLLVDCACLLLDPRVRDGARDPQRP